MKFIPAVKIELTTLLPPQEVRKLLLESIQPKEIPSFSFKRPKTIKSFEGYFHEDRFQIQRIITGRNSFLPQITGYIKPHLNGTKLVAELKLQSFVVVFMIAWLSILSLGLVLTVVGSFRNNDSEPSFILIPVFMILSGIGMAYFGFNTEKKKAISSIKRIISAQ